MPSETIRGENDAYVNEARPKDESGYGTKLTLRDDAPNRRFAYLWFPMPHVLSKAPFVSEALLRLIPSHPWNGTRTVRVRTLSEQWHPGSLNWDNKPGVLATEASVVVVDVPANTEIQVVITSLVQAIANSSPFTNYGFRVAIEDNDSGTYSLYSGNSASQDRRPKMDLSWAKIPQPPHDLFPSGSRSVSDSRPLLTWSFTPSDFGNVQAEAQVEVRNPTTDALIYDSGRRVFTDSQFDLETPPAGAPAFGALTEGAEAKWRVKVWDDDGLASEFSEYVRFRYDSAGVLTITSPTGTPAVTEDKTPPVTWTFTGRTQERMELTLWEWRAYEDGSTEWQRIHHVNARAYTLGSYTIPEGLITKRDNDYKLRLRVWDTLDREEHTRVQAVLVFRYARSGVPGAPLTFTLATSDPTPKLLADWTNPTAGRPDHFALWRDGEVLIPRLDPDVYETLAGASSYQAALYYSEPYVSHTYDLVAVVNSAGVLKESPPISQTKTIRPIGIWLVAPEDGVEVFVAAREQPDMSITEVGETFQPLGRRGAVRVVESIGGWAGTVSGTLSDFNGISVETYRDRLETLKGYVNQEEIRLLIGRYNIPVVLEEGTSFPPSPDGSYEVSLPFYQSGEYFTTRV